MAFISPAGMLAVTTGRSAVPDWRAVLMSAAPNSSPRSDGLIGAASTRIRTSSGPGCGTGTSRERELQFAAAPRRATAAVALSQSHSTSFRISCPGDQDTARILAGHHRSAPPDAGGLALAVAA